MFGRVQTFGNANAADFAAGSKAAGHFARLAQIVADLDVEKARQNGGSATAKEVLFDSLRLDLQAIARTARAIDAGEPGFADPFRPPPPRRSRRCSPPPTPLRANSPTRRSRPGSSPTNCRRISLPTSPTTSPRSARPTPTCSRTTRPASPVPPPSAA
jgi:hypothetical protein